MLQSGQRKAVSTLIGTDKYKSKNEIDKYKNQNENRLKTTLSAPLSSSTSG
ncbi:hypothetical protein CEXT_162111, partial [Caerostris extrusa]